MFLASFFVLFAAFFGISQIVPEYQKTQIYFTVKSSGDAPAGDHRQAAEGAEFIAEGISGWASDLGFQNAVQTKANIFLPKFKQKISARQQNRVNVFFTLSLPKNEWKHSLPLKDAILEVLNEEFETLNTNAAFSFEMTTPKVSQDTKNFPLSWILVTCFILAAFAGFGFVYLYEALTGKVSFLQEVQEIFPESALLRVASKAGSHDAVLLEQYILTFQSPRLLGTFKAAEKHFSLTQMTEMAILEDTPILMVKLGETKLHDLQNLSAIYGDNVGLIVFER